MKKLMILAVALIASSEMGAVHAAYVVVDDFTQGSLTPNNPANIFGNVVPIVQGNYATIAGGYRVIAATENSSGNTGFVAMSQNIAGFSPAPSLTFSPGGGSEYVTTITYDANGSLLNAGLGIDLTQNGADSLALRVRSADQNIRFTFTVYDTSGSGVKQSLVPGGVSAMNPQTLYFAFAGFLPGVDFTEVTKIVLTIDAIPADIGQDPIVDLDWSISNIQAATLAPEPTSLALAGFAGIGMAVGAIRRRRQAKQAA